MGNLGRNGEYNGRDAHYFLRKITEKQVWRNPNGKWVTPVAGDTREAVGMKSSATHIG